MDTLTALQHWYSSMCDGTWEHSFGVRIDTVDNPGWSVCIDLPNSVMQSFEPCSIERTEDDWLACKVADGCFKGYGGPENLTEILSTFLRWIQRSKKEDEKDTSESAD